MVIEDDHVYTTKMPLWPIWAIVVFAIVPFTNATIVPSL